MSLQASAKPQNATVTSPTQSTNPTHSSDPVYECTTSVVRSVMQLLQGVQKGQHAEYLELVKVSKILFTAKVHTEVERLRHGR